MPPRPSKRVSVFTVTWMVGGESWEVVVAMLGAVEVFVVLSRRNPPTQDEEEGNVLGAG